VFVKRLVEKHGDDYKAMARDHKLNTYQHTPKQLQRKIEKVHTTIDLIEKHDIGDVTK
jgi:nucleolar protein 16